MSSAISAGTPIEWPSPTAASSTSQMPLFRFAPKKARSRRSSPWNSCAASFQHVLPDRFHKIRHYGLYAASAAKEQLDVARQQLVPGSAQAVARHSSATVSVSWIEQLRTLTGRDVTRCPCCEGELASVPPTATGSAASEARVSFVPESLTSVLAGLSSILHLPRPLRTCHTRRARWLPLAPWPLCSHAFSLPSSLASRSSPTDPPTLPVFSP